MGELIDELKSTLSNMSAKHYVGDVRSCLPFELGRRTCNVRLELF